MFPSSPLAIGVSHLAGIFVVLGNQRTSISDFSCRDMAVEVRTGSLISTPTADLGRAGLIFILLGYQTSVFVAGR